MLAQNAQVGFSTRPTRTGSHAGQTAPSSNAFHESLLVRDKLPDSFIHSVFHRNGQRFSISRNRKASDRGYFSIAFVGLLNHVLVNPLYRDHGAAKIALEGRFCASACMGITNDKIDPNQTKRFIFNLVRAENMNLRTCLQRSSAFLPLGEETILRLSDLDRNFRYGPPERKGCERKGSGRCERIGQPCHSEQSEESAFVYFQRDKSRCFAQNV